MDPKYGCLEKDLARYMCRRTGQKIAIDGDLEKSCWRRAAKSGRFVDLVSGVPGFLETRMAGLLGGRAERPGPSHRTGFADLE
jgi:hypothetical protein